MAVKMIVEVLFMWLIEGTEDLNDTWHNVNVKKWKFVKLIPFAILILAPTKIPAKGNIANAVMFLCLAVLL